MNNMFKYLFNLFFKKQKIDEIKEPKILKQQYLDSLNEDEFSKE